MTRPSPVLLLARRELRILRRTHAVRRAALLLALVAWLPALLPPLRRGTLGVASFETMIPLQIAIAGVVLPLLALLAGAELFAGELEDGSLVPIVTLPISRGACFLGKIVGRGAVLGLAYVAAAASVGAGTALSTGVEHWRGWVGVALAGLLLSLATGGVGVALGLAGRGRVRAFGAALIAWVVLVVAVDAALLTAVVALAPAPPTDVGMHGHGELAPPGHAPPAAEAQARGAEPEPSLSVALPVSLAAVSPVSLFRLTALAAAPSLRAQLGLAIPGLSSAALRGTVAVGWLVWLGVPAIVAHRLFRRIDLQ